MQELKENQTKPCPQCDTYHSVHDNCNPQESKSVDKGLCPKCQRYTLLNGLCVECGPEKVSIKPYEGEWEICLESGALKEIVNNFVFINGRPSLTLHEAETVAIKIWELLKRSK